MGKRDMFNGSYGGFLKSEYPQLARWFWMEKSKNNMNDNQGYPYDYGNLHNILVNYNDLTATSL